ncbi:MAG: hypothetical protein ACXAC7_05925 [Candidatus Hodarchaeales archaeon]
MGIGPIIALIGGIFMVIPGIVYFSESKELRKVLHTNQMNTARAAILSILPQARPNISVPLTRLSEIAGVSLY